MNAGQSAAARYLDDSIAIINDPPDNYEMPYTEANLEVAKVLALQSIAASLITLAERT